MDAVGNHREDQRWTRVGVWVCAADLTRYIAEKGSITDGVSLTVNALRKDAFKLYSAPYQ